MSSSKNRKKKRTNNPQPKPQQAPTGATSIMTSGENIPENVNPASTPGNPKEKKAKSAKNIADNVSLSVPIIAGAIVAVVIIMLIVLLLGDKGALEKQRDDLDQNPTSAATSEDTSSPGTSASSTDVSGDKPAIPAGEPVSMRVDFANPEHAESVMVYNTTFEEVHNDLLDTYKGLEVYDSMYTFSVGVNKYVTAIKNNVQALGTFKELNEVTDNASYIAEQGVSDDGQTNFQLFMGVDGAQEIQISYNANKAQVDQNSDSVWETAAGLITTYTGAKMDKKDLSAFDEFIRKHVTEGGNFIFVVGDDEMQVNAQITVTGYNTEGEQWNFLGVRLIQDSQIQQTPDSLEQSTGEG